MGSGRGSGFTDAALRRERNDTLRHHADDACAVIGIGIRIRCRQQCGTCGCATYHGD